MLVLKFPRLRIPPSFLFGAKHFGTGVLVATAFVHLLPTAFGSLGDPCLSNFWTTDYQAMPGAIMLASVFFVTVIEMTFSPARHVCGGNEGVAAVSRPKKAPEAEMEEQPAPPQMGLERTYSESSMRVRDLGALKGRVGSISRTLSRYREDGQRLDAIESAGGSEIGEAPVELKKVESTEYAPPPDHESGDHEHVLSPEQIHRKAVMQVFLLEMGILFHSIFIGMSLAVSVGNDFTVLLIAIVFHRKLLPRTSKTYHTNQHRNFRRPRPRRPHCRCQMEPQIYPALAHGARIWLHVSFSFPPPPPTTHLSYTENATVHRAEWPLVSLPTRFTRPTRKSDFL